MLLEFFGVDENTRMSSIFMLHSSSSPDRTTCIKHWYVTRALQSLKGINLNWHNPLCVRNADLGCNSAVNGICQYPEACSKVVKILTPCIGLADHQPLVAGTHPCKWCCWAYGSLHKILGVAPVSPDIAGPSVATPDPAPALGVVGLPPWLPVPATSCHACLSPTRTWLPPGCGQSPSPLLWPCSSVSSDCCCSAWSSRWCWCNNCCIRVACSLASCCNISPRHCRKWALSARRCAVLPSTSVVTGGHWPLLRNEDTEGDTRCACPRYAAEANAHWWLRTLRAGLHTFRQWMLNYHVTAMLSDINFHKMKFPCLMPQPTAKPYFQPPFVNNCLQFLAAGYIRYYLKKR